MKKFLNALNESGLGYGLIFAITNLFAVCFVFVLLHLAYEKVYDWCFGSYMHPAKLSQIDDALAKSPMTRYTWKESNGTFVWEKKEKK